MSDQQPATPETTQLKQSPDYAAQSSMWKYVVKTLFSWVAGPIIGLCLILFFVSQNDANTKENVKLMMESYVDVRVGALEQRMDVRDKQLSGDIQALTTTVQNLVEVVKLQQHSRNVNQSSGNTNGNITVQTNTGGNKDEFPK